MVAKPDEVKQLATQAVTAGVMRVVAAVVDPQTAAKKLVEDIKELPLKALGRAMELPAELPKLAAGLPLKIALQAVATAELVRSLIPGQGPTSTPAEVSVPPVAAKAAGSTTWEDAAPKPAPEDYTPPVAGGHTAQAAKVLRTELKAVPTTAKAPGKKAPAKKAAAPASLAAEAVAPAASAVEAVATEIAKAVKAPAKKAAAKAPKPAAPVAEAEPLASVTPIHAGRDGHTDAPLPVTVEAAVEAAPAGATLGNDTLPLADYGSLSITQIRSRISKLTAVELVQLRDYERAHADRTPIVTLLETKLAKVTAETATTIDTASTVSSSAPGETAALIAEAPSNN